MSTRPTIDQPPADASPAEEAIVAMRRIVADTEQCLNEQLTTLSAAVFAAATREALARRPIDPPFAESPHTDNAITEMERAIHSGLGAPFAALCKATREAERRYALLKQETTVTLHCTACMEDTPHRPNVLRGAAGAYVCQECDAAISWGSARAAAPGSLEVGRIVETGSAPRATCGCGADLSVAFAGVMLGTPFVCRCGTRIALASPPADRAPTCRLEAKAADGLGCVLTVSEEAGMNFMRALETAASVILVRADDRRFVCATPLPKCRCGNTDLARIAEMVSAAGSASYRCRCGLTIGRDEASATRWEAQQANDRACARIAELEAEAAKRNRDALLNGVARGEAV